MRLVRLMCSGRVDLAHILRAFAKGADGVFIGGCRLGECNYITHGNYHALNLVLLSKKILEYLGLNPQRLHIAFMSGGEGNLFASVVNGFCETIKEIGPIGRQSGEISPARLEQAMTDIIRLVPYIKIEKHYKLTVYLEDETSYDNHFSLEEIKRLFDEVASYHIDPAKCQACMICARSCPVGVIGGGKAMVHVIDQERCIKCGTCLNVCPSRFGAVTKIVGGPVPPPLPIEQRTIVRKSSTEKNTSTEKALP